MDVVLAVHIISFIIHSEQTWRVFVKSFFLFNHNIIVTDPADTHRRLAATIGALVN